MDYYEVVIFWIYVSGIFFRVLNCEMIVWSVWVDLICIRNICFYYFDDFCRSIFLEIFYIYGKCFL